MIRKVLFLAAALSLFSLGTGQDLSKKIDYTTVAVPFYKAFADLSAQAGVRLVSSPELENEIITLRLKDVTLDEAMKRIAGTVEAEWQKRDGGYELVRTDEITGRLREHASEAQAAAFTKALAEQMRIAQLDVPFSDEAAARLASRYIQTLTGEDWRERAVVQGSLPNQRALWRILAQIDPKTLAGLQKFDRVVLSNKPTAMQIEIPQDLSHIAEQMKEEQNTLAAAYSKVRKPANANDPPRYPDEGIGEAMAEAPARFVIRVEKPQLADSFLLQMIAFDSANKAIARADASLNMSDWAKAMTERARVAKASDKEPDLETSAVAKQILDLMKKSMSGHGIGTEAPSGELREALLHPDTRDPLSYTISEAVLGVAGLKHENLVLYGDDSMFLIGLFAGQEGRLKPSLVMQALQGVGQFGATKFVEDAGWMTVAPVDPLGAIRTRANRPVLAQYLQAYDKDGFFSLESQAKLAASVKDYEMSLLDQFLPMLLNPDWMAQEPSDLSMLKFYASLDEGQLQRLNSKDAIRLAELAPDQVSLLTYYVYVSDQSRRSAPYEQGTSYIQGLANAEPTEALPNGLPNDGTVSMSITSAPTYYVKIMNGDMTYTQPMDISNLAYMLYLKDHPERSPNYHPQVVSLEAGETRNLKFTLSLGPKITREAVLKEQHKTPGGPWTVDKLPDSIKKQLDAAMAQYRNMGSEADDDSDQPSQLPSKTPPPRY